MYGSGFVGMFLEHARRTTNGAPSPAEVFRAESLAPGERGERAREWDKMLHRYSLYSNAIWIYISCPDVLAHCILP